MDKERCSDIPVPFCEDLRNLRINNSARRLRHADNNHSFRGVRERDQHLTPPLLLKLRVAPLRCPQA
jgi:hypothetical protein